MIRIPARGRLSLRYFYWKGLYRDVERFCEGCLICQRNKPKNRPREPLEPITIAEEPRHAIAYDIATLPWSTDSHRYFLIMTDIFSKFVEVYPMADQTAESVCKGLLQGWIHRYGPPRIMLSDQGPNVDGKLVREMLGRLGIEKRRSSPYHPEGDDQAEKGVQTVKQAMRCLLEERSIEKDNWPSIIQEVSYNLNCLPSSSTGYPPYTVMYGVATTSLSMTCLPRSNRGGDTTQEWLEEVTNARGVVNSNVNSNLSESRSRMKSNYRCSTSPTNVQAADKVLL